MRNVSRTGESTGTTVIRQVAIYVASSPHSEDRVFLARADELGEELAELATKRLTEQGAVYSKKYIGGAASTPRPPA